MKLFLQLFIIMAFLIQRSPGGFWYKRCWDSQGHCRVRCLKKEVTKMLCRDYSRCCVHPIYDLNDEAYDTSKPTPTVFTRSFLPSLPQFRTTTVTTRRTVPDFTIIRVW